MDALKFVKDFRRLCYSHDCCVDCPCFKDSNENCNLLSVNLTDKEIIKYIEIVEEWAKEHPVKIDWSKVPANTPVYVRDDLNLANNIKHFASYDPVAKSHFLCYAVGKTSWTTTETTHWKYCELVREEDIKKYAKAEVN